MTKKPNSTSVLSASPISSDFDSRSVSIDVRKIDNGYVTRRSVCEPGRPYESSECYSKEPPKLDGQGTDRMVGRESLKDAIKSLG